ncbi:acetate--CoA ligase family protein [Uniformispora flossi]|uniref:acetate--CoA ligase family protein n=1 Tax=Uniformispora flossi TaxID=3390723 RepID=UPI003C2DA08B
MTGEPGKAVPGKAVPEHEVKALLAGLGVAVPRGIVVDAGEREVDWAARAGSLGPLVLKAYGPGIVHKTDVGAVRLGLNAATLPDAVRAMRDRLADHGIIPDGWLVEEQQPPGVELIAGVIRGPFGLATLFGHGGVLAETLDQAVVRLQPLGDGGAAALVDALPGAAVLHGVRGGAAVDLDAVTALLRCLDGVPEAVAKAYPGFVLDAFECNPVIATPHGAVAVDARLILRAADAPEPPRDGTDFTRLFAPRTVAVAGASTTKVTFGNRFLAAYRAFGRTDGLYAVHPTAAEVDGVPAVPSVAEIPGGADYLLVAVPAAATPDLVAGTAGHARFVHVVSGGFREAGDAGLEARLAAAARDAGVRLLGPNCLGVYAPAGRQTFQLGVSAEPGGVGVVSQSGGLAGDIVAAGIRRGLRFSGLVTIGNAVDVDAAELLGHFADDPATRVIGLYVEGTGGGERLTAALRRAADRGKPVVALVGGRSRQGARAVASHTGALAGDARMWQALCADTGLTVVDSLEDFLAVLGMFQRYAGPSRGAEGVLVVGPGGGASVLATDACDRAGLDVRPLPPETVAGLRRLGYGAGTSLVNPIEIPLGPAVEGGSVFARVLAAVADSGAAYGDALLHVNVQSYYGYADTGAAPLVRLVDGLAELPPSGPRLSLVLRNLECAPPDDAEAIAAAGLRAAIPLFGNLDQAAAAIAAVRRRQGLLHPHVHPHPHPHRLRTDDDRKPIPVREL